MGILAAAIPAVISGAAGAVASNNSGGGNGNAGWWDRLFGAGGALLSNAQYQEALDRYMAAADAQMADATEIASRIGPETQATYDDASREQLGVLQDLYRSGQQGTQDLYRATGQNRGDFLRDLDTRSRDLLGGYQDRYNTAERDIEGYGEQMRADIDEGAARRKGEFAINPLSRGSTIGASVYGNIEKDRAAEQRRLGEDLTRQRVNLLSGLSGDQLNAQGGLDQSRAAFDAALRGQLLDTQRYGFETGQNAMGNIGNYYNANAINRSGITNQGLNTYLNTVSGQNLIPPQQNNVLMQQLGNNAGGNTQYPDASNQYWANALPGISTAIGNAAGSAFAGGGEFVRPSYSPGGGF